MFENDKRIVMTLDAGGTNFVFSAFEGGKEVLAPICLPSVPDNIEKCLEQLVKGFKQVENLLAEKPCAISFAFPGPADYQHGIIGDLSNFPAFRGGVALGPFLSKVFDLPVYINNDGNLYAYGEALCGNLQDINQNLKSRGSSRQYHNLIGVTLGTGFGCGVVVDGVLLTGDNGCGGDMWLMRNSQYPSMIAEESVSIRGIQRMYQEYAQQDASNLTPKDIFDIAEGTKNGVREAAVKAFHQFGEVAGDAIVHALDIVDGLVVLGGGVSKAHKYILPGILEELHRHFQTFKNDSFPCLQMQVYNLTDPEEADAFYRDESVGVQVPGYPDIVPYIEKRKVGISISAVGANRAIALGAYSYALQQIDKNHLNSKSHE